MKDEWEYEQEAEFDRILGQTTALLAQRGDIQAVALLVDVQAMSLANTDEVIRTEKRFDPWSTLTDDDSTAITYTIYRREAIFDVDEHLLGHFTLEVTERIAKTLSYVADRNGQPNVEFVRARPALPDVDNDWRQSYADQLSREQPTNQARREIGKANHPVEDGLTFASREELQVYRGLKRLQTTFPEETTIAIVPLPGVRLRTGHTWSPDVMVVGQGRAMIFEIDGPHHRNPRRYADDRNRDLQWQRCGVEVVRLAVDDLADEAALDARLREEVRRHLGSRK